MGRMVIWFDLDGVIFDSYEIWDQVVQRMLKHHGIAYTQQIREQLWQIPIENANAYVLQLIDNPYDEQELERQKIGQLQTLYRNIPLIEGARELLLALKAQGIALYAVTSNYQELAELGLSTNHLLKYFEKLYSSLDVIDGDKNKEFFQYILNKEKLDPKDVIIVEDNAKNICIAKELGIAGVHIHHPTSPMQDKNTNLLSIRHLNELIPILEDRK